jgi:hypothetical protein
VSQQPAEASRQRMPETVDAHHAEQRSFQRAARHEDADKAKPKPDRARPAQADAAWQHRLHKTPQEREEPDG